MGDLVWAVISEEIPTYNQLYDAFKGQDVAIVGIAVDSNAL
jgi:alkyl hydroperoxide reductase subunit AhpC